VNSVRALSDWERRSATTTSIDQSINRSNCGKSFLAKTGIILFALGASWQVATPAGSIVGRVVDASGSVLPGVVIVATAGGEKRTTTTNIRGEYRLDQLPPGRYQARANLAGFAPVTFEAMVAADHITEWNPVLRVVPLRGPEEALLELRGFAERFTGPGWIDCGQHALERPFVSATEEDLKISLTCGLDAARQKKAFMTLKQTQGIDSLIFQGLLGTPDGRTYRFGYDSAPCGGPGCSGRFSVEQCDRPSVARSANLGPEFRCQR
jgi:hypothetical protein